MVPIHHILIPAAFVPLISGQTPVDATLVDTPCGPMPLEFFNFISKPKDICICVANQDYNGCVDASGDGDASGQCGVNQCQDYNFCEMGNQCATTVPPGLQELDCSTTVKQYPNYPASPRLFNRTGLGVESLITCGVKSQIGSDYKAILAVTESLYQGYNALANSTT